MGADALYGGAGNDTLIGGGGTNFLDGGPGADHLDGTGGISWAGYADATVGVTVNLLNPSLNTGDAAGDSYVDIHRIQGSSFADTLTADNAGDVIYGEGGDDIITGGAGADTLYGGPGNDTLIGGGGTNFLDGGPGADHLDGTGGISWASYRDATVGVTVNLLNPALNTGDAAGDSYVDIHRIQGSNFSDTLTADNAGDVIQGFGGNDVITGGTGNDILIGGAGNDNITGGGGADTLTGGTGNATFVYQVIGDSTPTASDTITDFHTGDRIDVSAIDANTGLAGLQHFSISTTPGAGHIVIAYMASVNITVVRLYDNASGVMDGRILLAGDHALTAADFILTPGGGASHTPAPSTAGFVAAMASSSHAAGAMTLADHARQFSSPILVSPRLSQLF